MNKITPKRLLSMSLERGIVLHLTPNEGTLCLCRNSTLPTWKAWTTLVAATERLVPILPNPTACAACLKYASGIRKMNAAKDAVMLSAMPCDIVVLKMAAGRQRINPRHRLLTLLKRRQELREKYVRCWMEYEDGPSVFSDWWYIARWYAEQTAQAGKG